MKKKKINTKLPTKLSRKYLVIVAIVIGVAGLLYFFKSAFIVGWVNGRPLTRTAYVRELEKLAKTQAFDSLVTKQLIVAEANKQNISVNRAEIDESMTNIDARAQEQGSNLDQLLAAQGISRKQVEEEVRLQKMLEKMVGAVGVSDEEVNAYWEQNKEMYPDQKLDDVKEDIKDQLTQQTMIGKIQELITRLQSEAKIVNWQQ
jgi:FKBP-type peptidyl-prolyl cis-trans isomerase (trigger factor)